MPAQSTLRNVILDPNGQCRWESAEDRKHRWYASMADARATAPEETTPSPEPDYEDVTSQCTSSNASPLSTLPTMPSELSKKAQANPTRLNHPRSFNYDHVDWQRMPGFSIPNEKGPSRLTSPIWRFGVPITCADNEMRYWMCTECHIKRSAQQHIYKAETGCSAATQHIQLVHGKHWNRAKEIITWSREPNPPSPLELDAHVPREQAILNAMASAFDEATFRRLLVRWIVCDNVSFRQVDSEPFREFIRYISPRGGDSMPTDKTIRSWIMSAYALHKVLIASLLGKAISKIHICFDLWTSGNQMSLDGVTAHFIDSDFKSQSLVLGAPQQVGRHTGEKIGEQVIEVLRSYGIQGSQLGYFVLDNASNNDGAMDVIAREFGFDKTERRLRCAGHVINLIARSLLYGFDKNLFEEEELELIGKAEDNLAIWRRCGPVGKAHLLVKWTYASTQRIHRWHEGERRFK